MTNEVLESLGVRPVASLAPPDHSIRLEWRFLGRGHYANRLIAVALAGGESSDGESQNLIARQCDWLSRLIFKASGICVLCCPGLATACSPTTYGYQLESQIDECIGVAQSVFSLCDRTTLQVENLTADGNQYWCAAW